MRMEYRVSDFEIIDRETANEMMAKREVQEILEKGSLLEIVQTEGFVPVEQWTDKALIESALYFGIADEMTERKAISLISFHELLKDYAECRKIPLRWCGDTADWSIDAWQLGGEGDLENGAYFLLDDDEDEPSLYLVQRFLLGEEGYEGDGCNDETRIIEGEPRTKSGLRSLLNTFKEIMYDLES
jgi:hypothetical protein